MYSCTHTRPHTDECILWEVNTVQQLDFLFFRCTSCVQTVSSSVWWKPFAQMATCVADVEINEDYFWLSKTLNLAPLRADSPGRLCSHQFVPPMEPNVVHKKPKIAIVDVCWSNSNGGFALSKVYFLLKKFPIYEKCYCLMWLVSLAWWKETTYISGGCKEEKHVIREILLFILYWTVLR